MEKFDSISHFLQSGEFDYRVYDMGRKVWEIPNALFTQIENQIEQYPYPFQQKAWLALIFWPKNKQHEAVIWFLQFPVDELGFLKQGSRDAFLIDLLEQTGKNIQAKQLGEKVEDQLTESPFAFKPREDRLAMFHAIATTILNQSPSQHYQYAHDYLKADDQGSPGFEQWQFLGLQGIADVVARLDVDDNASLLAKAVTVMPDIPLSSFAHALENVSFDESLFDSLVVRVEAELTKQETNVPLISSLIRSVSSFSHDLKKKMFIGVILENPIALEIEVIAAISGRSWRDLEDKELRKVFIDKLSKQEQVAFSAIIADLIMIPGMRDLILGEMRSDKRSSELAQKFGIFMQGVGSS